MPRTPEDRAADKLTAETLIPKLRQARRAARNSVRALPAKASRNANQARDAQILNGQAIIYSTLLIMLGVADDTDREDAED